MKKQEIITGVCPICGSEAIELCDNKQNKQHSYLIKCKNCGAKTFTYRVSKDCKDEEAKRKALRAWNSRLIIKPQGY